MSRLEAYPWLTLVIAGLLEVGWAIGIKYTHGFTRLWPSVWTIAAMVVSMFLLAVAIKSIPVGTGYAVWTGIGAVGAAILGIVLLGEPASALRIGCIALIVAGILGLKMTSRTATPAPAPAAAAAPGEAGADRSA